MSRVTQADRTESIERLKKLCPAGSTVYTVLRHVSRSGMSRLIDVYVMNDGEPLRITWGVATACGFSYDRKQEALRIGGCGMDMGFAVVYELSAALYRNGFACVGDHCPSNDHSNGLRETCSNCNAGVRESDGERCEECHGYGTIRKSFPRGPNVTHSEGGYSLRQRWM